MISETTLMIMTATLRLIEKKMIKACPDDYKGHANPVVLPSSYIFKEMQKYMQKSLVMDQVGTGTI